MACWNLLEYITWEARHDRSEIFWLILHYFMILTTLEKCFGIFIFNWLILFIIENVILQFSNLTYWIFQIFDWYLMISSTEIKNDRQNGLRRFFWGWLVCIITAVFLAGTVILLNAECLLNCIVPGNFQSLNWSKPSRHSEEFWDITMAVSAVEVVSSSLFYSIIWEWLTFCLGVANQKNCR